MQLADLLSESYATDLEESWERERTATPVRVFAVRLHATGCSLRETQAILRLIGVERSHQAIWHWYIGWLTACQTRRRPRERSSRAAHQNAKRSEDGAAVAGRH